jgi:hypothetical protein
MVVMMAFMSVALVMVIAVLAVAALVIVVMSMTVPVVTVMMVLAHLDCCQQTFLFFFHNPKIMIIAGSMLKIQKLMLPQ